MATKRDPKRYPVQLHWSAEDEGWIATFPDLPGCSAWGATEAEALAESHDAAAVWLKACRAAGNPIPAPSPLADAAARSSRPHSEAVIELLRNDPAFADEYLQAAMKQADQEGGREALLSAQRLVAEANGEGR